MAKKVCILGGGASGLYCAMHMKLMHPAMEVTVLERGARVGKKLLATGNGKCNFTNLNQSKTCYSGESTDMAFALVQAHPPKDIIHIFAEIGVESIEKNGLVYPRSQQAASVLDALRFKLEALGVHIRTDFEVKATKKQGDVFVLSGTAQEKCDAVVIASGTAASGGSAIGVKLLRSFGHTAATVYPALTPVMCDTSYTKLAKGMRAQCSVQLCKNGAPIASESGEVLFTEYGISGICIMQLSRHISKAKAENEKASFHFEIDFAPEKNEADLLAFYINRRQTLGYLQTSEFLDGYLNKKIGQAVLKSCGITDFNAPASNLTDAQLTNLTKETKCFKLEISGVLDASHAQACGGGIRLSEFTEHLESTKTKNLFACGEVLDVLGDCGGYNLTWAWASAYAVARGVNK